MMFDWANRWDWYAINFCNASVKGSTSFSLSVGPVHHCTALGGIDMDSTLSQQFHHKLDLLFKSPFSLGKQYKMVCEGQIRQKLVHL